jgi:GntR family transcriptional regulator/MocR family aminotransferase
MPIARRHDLLQLANSTGAVTLEDDYDSEFHYDGKPVAALQGLDTSGHVFYVGTIAKAMFSGVRVGNADQLVVVSARSVRT